MNILSGPALNILLRSSMAYRMFLKYLPPKFQAKLDAGGGFGGKESQSTIYAAFAALSFICQLEGS